jgi:cation:H+ antiporter
MILVKLIVGLVILVLGAEILVKGASKVAAAFGISSLVIGLTIVAFGTSSPELGVSLMASLGGNPDVAIGNVLGSNIFNVLFILGISSIVVPLVVAQQLIRLDVPVMIGVSLLMLVFALDGRIRTWEAATLVVIGVGYTGYLIWASRREKNQEVLKEYDNEFGQKTSNGKGSLAISVAMIAIGLGALVLGSRWLVEGAVFLAQQFGVSDLVIGLTVIAVGTSLPEVATSLVASIRGERDIAVGNIVGSNIFNIVFILGITGCVSTGGIAVAQSALYFDIPVMIAVAIACLPIFFTGSRLDRWEGGVFLFYYVAYTVYLVMSVNQNPSLELFSVAMKWFVLPITILTLMIVTFRAIRKRPGSG